LPGILESGTKVTGIPDSNGNMVITLMRGPHNIGLTHNRHVKIHP